MDENELTNRYFRYVKTCGCIIGLWPFQTGWKSCFSRGIIYLCFVSAIFTQGSRIVLFYSFDTVAEQIPFVGVALLSMTKYLNYISNKQKLVQILLDMPMDWKVLSTDEEIEIMQMYVKRATMFSFLYKLNIYFACGTFGSLPFIPRILDLVKPLNESRAWLLVYPAHYYIDQEKYYYYLLTHTLICMVAAAIALLFSDCLIIYMVQHACSLLSVTGYRFKHAVDKVTDFSTKECDTSNNIIFEKLRISIRTHNRAIQFLRGTWQGNLTLTLRGSCKIQLRIRSNRVITEIDSTYSINLFLQVGMAMVMFSITLLMIALKSFSIDMCPVYGFILVQLVHLLFLTIQGQFVRDSCDNVYSAIYEALWYETHPRFQKFYVLALRRSLTPPALTAGGLIALDLNSFAEILKTSVSYYTVLKSR